MRCSKDVSTCASFQVMPRSGSAREALIVLASNNGSNSWGSPCRVNTNKAQNKGVRLAAANRAVAPMAASWAWARAY